MATKPRSKAKINPTKTESASRHVGRIGRLRDAITKAESRKQPERVASLKAELDRRLAEVAEIKKELDSI